MFDEVIVAVGHNAKKTYLFSIEERVELARQALADIDAVRSGGHYRAHAEFAQKKQGAAAIVRGCAAGRITTPNRRWPAQSASFRD